MITLQFHLPQIGEFNLPYIFGRGMFDKLHVGLYCIILPTEQILRLCFDVPCWSISWALTSCFSWISNSCLLSAIFFPFPQTLSKNPSGSNYSNIHPEWGGIYYPHLHHGTLVKISIPSNGQMKYTTAYSTDIASIPSRIIFPVSYAHYRTLSRFRVVSVKAFPPLPGILVPVKVSASWAVGVIVPFLANCYTLREFNKL